MRRSIWFACAAVLGASQCIPAVADIVDNSGGALIVPDNDPAGITGVIEISDNELIADVDVNLFGVTHSWVGDLIIRITSPGGTTADIIVRTGDTTGGSGDSSDLNGDYTFSDGGSDWWAAANAAGSSDSIAAGTYEATTTNGGVVSLAAAFAGEETAGTWTLFASDNSNGDTGSISGWGLNITSSTIPEPTFPTVLGLLAVLGVGRRTRRNCNRDDR